MFTKMRIALSCIMFGLGAAGTAVAQSSPAPFTSYNFYDQEHRVIGTVQADAGDQATPVYDAVRSTYDATGRLTKVETGYFTNVTTWISQPTPFTVNWSGFTVVDETDTTYDELNRKLTETKASNGTAYVLTQYTYDADGRVQCVAQRLNASAFGSLPASACTLGTAGNYGPDRITRTTYDTDSHVTEVDQAVGVTTANGFQANVQRAYARYTYNPNGTKATETDANGNTTTMIYDGDDRLSQLQYPSPTTAGSSNTADYEAYTYDLNNNRLTWRRRNGITIDYVYDGLDRETEESVPGTSMRSIFTTYDYMSRMLGKTFDSATGPGTSYAYDGLGRLTSATDFNNKLIRYQYNADSARTQMTYPDGEVINYSLDNLDNILSVVGSARTIYSEAYDSLGRPTSLTRMGVTTQFGYDPIGRLNSYSQTFAGTTGASTIWGFSFSPASQIVGFSSTTSMFENIEIASTTDNRTFNGLNQDSTIAAISGGYDANGNLANEGAGGRVMTYDVYNRLLTLTGDGKSLAFTYDPEGRLASYSNTVSGNTSTALFTYDGTELVEEYNGAGGINGRYYSGAAVDQPLVYMDGSGTYHGLDQNYQGSVIALTDATGNIQSSFIYGSYGEPKNASGQLSWSGSRFMYTGQVAIPEAQLYYYRARVYDPIYGRFLQTDPIGSADDLDLYAYTGDDPVNAADPTGNDQEPTDQGLSAFWSDSASKAIDGQANPASSGGTSGNGNTSGTSHIAPVNTSETASQAISNWITPQSVSNAENGSNPADPSNVNRSFDQTALRISAKGGEAALSSVVLPEGEVGLAESSLQHLCCFVAGTKVSTKAGLRPIEDIKVGDFVLSKDPDTGLTDYKPVIGIAPRHNRRIFEVCFKESMPDGSSRTEVIYTTREHPWRTADEKWTETGDLKTGEVVLAAYGKGATVAYIHDTKRLEPTYNLVVADFHTYFVGDGRLWVHNCILANKANGDAFRDSVAELFKAKGFDVQTEVYKATIFGKRFIDVELSQAGKVVGGLETKWGRSAYTASQRAKDAWLYMTRGYKVQVIRGGS